MFHGEKLERYLYKYVPNRVLYLLDQARECERAGARTDAYAYRQQVYELAYLLYNIGDRQFSDEILIALEDSASGAEARKYLENMVREEE